MFVTQYTLDILGTTLEKLVFIFIPSLNIVFDNFFCGGVVLSSNGVFNMNILIE